MPSNTKNHKQSNQSWKSLIILIVITLLIQSIAGLIIYFALPDWPKRGQFGDLFGMVNALFSGLAFAGVVYAIILQRQELSLQREELRLTREELKRSAEAQENAEIIQKQRLIFEGNIASARLGISLYNEWHGDPIHQSRVSVERYIKRVGIHSLNYENMSEEEYFHLIRVLHFFERWALLVDCRQVDREFMNNLLGDYLQSWSFSLLKPLLYNSKGQPYERILTIISHVLLINEQVENPSPEQASVH